MVERAIDVYASSSPVRIVFALVGIAVSFTPIPLALWMPTVEVDGYPSFSQRQVILAWAVAALMLLNAAELTRGLLQQWGILKVVSFVEHSSGVWIATTHGWIPRTLVVEGDPLESTLFYPLRRGTTPWGFSWTHAVTVCGVDSVRTVHVFAGDVRWDS